MNTSLAIPANILQRNSREFSVNFGFLEKRYLCKEGFKPDYIKNRKESTSKTGPKLMDKPHVNKFAPKNLAKKKDKAAEIQRAEKKSREQEKRENKDPESILKKLNPKLAKTKNNPEKKLTPEQKEKKELSEKILKIEGDTAQVDISQLKGKDGKPMKEIELAKFIEKTDQLLHVEKITIKDGKKTIHHVLGIPAEIDGKFVYLDHKGDPISVKTGDRILPLSEDNIKNGFLQNFWKQMEAKNRKEKNPKKRSTPAQKSKAAKRSIRISPNLSKHYRYAQTQSIAGEQFKGNNWSIEKKEEVSENVVSRAEGLIGKIPYIWGGTSLETGADCSGFTQSILREQGIQIPRNSESQSKTGEAVKRNELQKGDLVFFKTTNIPGRTVTHVGVYAGNEEFVHAQGRKTGVVKTSMSKYEKRFVNARRYI